MKLQDLFEARHEIPVSYNKILEYFKNEIMRSNLWSSDLKSIKDTMFYDPHKNGFNIVHPFSLDDATKELPFEICTANTIEFKNCAIENFKFTKNSTATKLIINGCDGKRSNSSRRLSDQFID